REAEPEEERAAPGGVAVQEAQSVVGEDLLREAGDGLVLGGDPMGQLRIAVVGAAIGQPGPHLVETALPRSLGDVPLADQYGAVAGVPQQARDRRAPADGLGDSGLLVLGGVDAVAKRRQAGDQAGTNRMALGD